MNEERFLCISNLSSETHTIAFKDEWLDRENGVSSAVHTLASGEIIFLKMNGRCGDV